MVRVGMFVVWVWLWWVRFVGGGSVLRRMGREAATTIVRVPAPYIYSRKRVYMLMATTDIVKKAGERSKLVTCTVCRCD